MIPEELAREADRCLDEHIAQRREAFRRSGVQSCASSLREYRVSLSPGFAEKMAQPPYGQSEEEACANMRRLFAYLSMPQGAQLEPLKRWFEAFCKTDLPIDWEAADESPSIARFLLGAAASSFTNIGGRGAPLIAEHIASGKLDPHHWILSMNMQSHVTDDMPLPIFTAMVQHPDYDVQAIPPVDHGPFKAPSTLNLLAALTQTTCPDIVGENRAPYLRILGQLGYRIYTDETRHIDLNGMIESNYALAAFESAADLRRGGHANTSRPYDIVNLDLEKCLEITRIGGLMALFEPTVWRGHEAQALGLLDQLHPVVTAPLARERAAMEAAVQAQSRPSSWTRFAERPTERVRA